MFDWMEKADVYCLVLMSSGWSASLYQRGFQAIEVLWDWYTVGLKEAGLYQRVGVLIDMKQM